MMMTCMPCINAFAEREEVLGAVSSSNLRLFGRNTKSTCFDSFDSGAGDAWPVANSTGMHRYALPLADESRTTGKKKRS
jgi:hypothetical protein